MPVETVAYVRAEDLSVDQRWDAWVAKGVVHDRKSGKRMLVFLAALGVSAVVTAGILLLR
jgi:hypothetical protein